MSSEYIYYLGYIDNKTKKVHALGPFNDKGELRSVFWRTPSTVSDLPEMFRLVKIDEMDNYIKDTYTHKSSYDDENLVSNLYMLNYDKLPNNDYIKRGYYLIEDVKKYEENNDTEELFYDNISSEVYAEKLKNELLFGKPAPEKDCEGFEYTPKAASDYMWFAFPDYFCEAYESHLLKSYMESLCSVWEAEKRDITRVILLYKDW